MNEIKDVTTRERPHQSDHYCIDDRVINLHSFLRNRINHSNHANSLTSIKSKALRMRIRSAFLNQLPLVTLHWS